MSDPRRVPAALLADLDQLARGLEAHHRTAGPSTAGLSADYYRAALLAAADLPPDLLEHVRLCGLAGP